MRGLDADVLIAGGGPAGCAAAIECAGLGLRVILAEREVFPRPRPGEALHPGVDAVLGELGVLDRIDEVTGARFDGVEIAWNGPAVFQPFGADEDGPWLGRQVDRARLDALLLDRAKDLGVTVLQPCAVREPITEHGRVVGAVTDQGDARCRVLIDASGAGRLLSRRLALPETAASPAGRLRYGYVVGGAPALDARPSIAADPTGWTWIARVAPDRIQWVRLDFGETVRGPDWRPAELADLIPDGPSKGADAAWRLCQASAGPGWFVAGDAAAQLDPAASHGVLKALMTGVMAARTAAAFLVRQGDEAEGAAAYRGWLSGWFETDIAELGAQYAALGAPGYGQAYGQNAPSAI